MIRTLVVEDVDLAGQALARLLRAHGDVQVLGVAATGAEALDKAASLKPDLLFLDVGLPDMDGIDVARRLPDPKPAMVFLTAHPEHALPAFEVAALDYLLKPAGAEGVARALDRVRRALGRAGAPPPPSVPDHLEIRDGGRTRFVPLAEIDHVDAAGHYLCIHQGREVHLLRLPIAELAERLGPDFVRVHRSALVRLDRVVEIVDRRNGDGDVRLTTGAVVPLSRTWREALEARLSHRRR